MAAPVPAAEFVRALPEPGAAAEAGSLRVQLARALEALQASATQCDSLKSQLADKSAQIATLEAERQAHQAKQQQVRPQVRATRHATHQHAPTGSFYTAQHAIALTHFQAAADAQKMQAVLAQTQAELAQAKAAQARSKQMEDEVGASMHLLRGELLSLRNEVDASRKERDKLNKQAASASHSAEAELAALREQVAAGSQLTAEQRSELSKSQAAAAKSSAALRAAKAQLQHMQSALAAAEQQSARDATQLAQAEQHSHDYAEVIKQLEGEIARLKAALAAASKFRSTQPNAPAAPDFSKYVAVRRENKSLQNQVAALSALTSSIMKRSSGFAVPPSRGLPAGGPITASRAAMQRPARRAATADSSALGADRTRLARSAPIAGHQPQLPPVLDRAGSTSRQGST